MLWGLIFPVQVLCLGWLAWGLFLSFVVSLIRSLVPYPVSALPILFNVASSLWLTLESLFCQSLSFFRLITLMWLFSRCVHGIDELKILLLSHLSWELKHLILRSRVLVTSRLILSSLTNLYTSVSCCFLSPFFSSPSFNLLDGDLSHNKTIRKRF